MIMLFTSMEFLLVFFPVTLGIYFILPHKARNVWLLAASLFFYAWGEPVFVLAMVFSIVFNYLLALRIDELARYNQPGKTHPGRKILFIFAICVNLSILFVYKYMNFVTGTLHEIFPATQSMFEKTNYTLPIGISFFTFQAMSYVIDVYRGIPAQKSILNIGLYISLFPQLIAGPIVRYTTVMEQLEDRCTTLSKFTKGFKRFLIGFNKKVLLANIMALVADHAFGSAELSVCMAWLGAIAYALQIYFDFSGYSEMAIGLGQIFGFDFLENFNYPYISKTITEFWRRWHMSLGTWFRDYLYFPLGGSRVKSRARLVFNLAVVWLATGIWHGANWNFILWGVLYGVLLIIEKLFTLPKKLEKKKTLSGLYQAFAMLMVLFGWVLFRAEDMPSALHYLRSMVGTVGNELWNTDFLVYCRDYLIMVVAALVFALPVCKKIKEWLMEKFPRQESLLESLALVLQAILFIVSVSFLAMNAHNPFIYFNF